MFKFGKQSLKNANGVNNDLLLCASRALSKCRYHDMTIPHLGGKRSTKQQNDLYKLEKSHLDGINKLSYHQSRNALDVTVYELRGDLQDKMIRGDIPVHEGFREFAKHMLTEWQKGLNSGEFKGVLEWGGNWSRFIDLPHWQVRL